MNNQIITHPNYKPEGIVYGFIGKKLKLSSHHYKTKYGVVQENKEKVLAALGRKSCNLSLLKQVHGIKCITVDQNSTFREESEADGQVTASSSAVLGIQTADCIPILFVDLKNRIVGAAHSGWRGSLAGIIPSTIRAMESLGSTVEDIDVVIGPAIHQDSYEVDRGFFERFKAEASSNVKFFKESHRVNHYLFDLIGYAKAKLSNYKFKNIFDIDIDTLKDEENFFSYRRCTLKGEPLDGHILSVIGLE